MMKLTALYTPPDDAAAFDEHYTSVHIPMVDTLPGLVRQETAVVAGTPDGSPPAYHRQADLYFEDAAALNAAFASDVGRATARDAAQLAASTGSTITFLVSQVERS